MTRFKNDVPAHAAERVREELAAAREHLQAAAKHGTDRLGDRSRRTSRIARNRASNAALALRGERPASPWRWLGIGLAAGAAAGAVSVVVLRQMQRTTQQDLPEQVSAATGAVRERASEAAGTVRERAGAAAQRATAAARETADKVRGTRGQQPATEPEPPAGETNRRASPASAGE